MECKRCHKEFENPVPEVTYPEGIHEIASKEWCAACNALVMSIVYRESSAYNIFKTHEKGVKYAG